MANDKNKPNEVCPDCPEENGSVERRTNDTDGSCSCCCSCSDTDSDSVSVARESYSKYNMEQRKKDLLSNLSILRTNQEPASVERVLQFVEALQHSTEFLRRYNMQNDFCLDCLISQPTCTCCTNDFSQLNINGDTHDSCDECNRSNENHRRRSSPNECPDCVPTFKGSVPRRRRTNLRRGHRNYRRRQARSHGISPRRNSSPNEAPDLSSNSGVDQSTDGKTDAAREVTCGSNVAHNSCTDCVYVNSPSSSSSPSSKSCSCYGNREQTTNRSHRRDLRNAPEQPCTCCTPPESSRRNRNPRQKRKKRTPNSKSDQKNETLSTVNKEESESSGCSCEECQSLSDSSSSTCSCSSCETTDQPAENLNKKGRKK